MTDNEVQRLMRRVDELHADHSTLHTELQVAKAILERIEGHLERQNGRIGKTEARLSDTEKRVEHFSGRRDQADRTAAFWKPSVPSVLAGVALLLLGALLRSFV